MNHSLQFMDRTLYANVVNDPLVSHLSAGILSETPFSEQDKLGKPVHDADPDGYEGAHPEFPSLVVPKKKETTSDKTSEPVFSATVPNGRPSEDVSLSDTASTAVAASEELPTPKSETSPSLPSKPNADSSENKASIANTTRKAATLALSPVFIVVALTALTGMLGTFHFKRTQIVVSTAFSSLSTSKSKDKPKAAEVEQERHVFVYNPLEVAPHELESVKWVQDWLEKSETVELSDAKSSESTHAAMMADFLEYYNRLHLNRPNKTYPPDCNSKDFIIWGLNKLTWKRVFVKTVHRRSHAAIIKRAPQFGGSEDIVRHYTEVVLFPTSNKADVGGFM
jgi:hypothetical protein